MTRQQTLYHFAAASSFLKNMFLLEAQKAISRNTQTFMLAGPRLTPAVLWDPESSPRPPSAPHHTRSLLVTSLWSVETA